MSLRAKRSNLSKYKKEIWWLLKEKYHYSEEVILNGVSDLVLNKPINPARNATHSVAGGQYTNTPINSPIYELTNLQTIQIDIQRILNGEPVDYVIGFKEFLNCKIDLSLKPLIPRIETEFWVSQIIADSRSQIADSNILDLCCGSGCIGISIFKNIPNCNVTFADISDNALSQTKININLNCHPERSEALYGMVHGEGSLHLDSIVESDSTQNDEKLSISHPGGSETSDRIQGKDSIATLQNDKLASHSELVSESSFQIIKSNLFENLQWQKFDYIFTNPPYVKQKDINGSLIYEPELALDGKGEDGLEIIFKILEEFSKYLNPGGKLFLEFGFGQKQKIKTFIKSSINQLPCLRRQAITNYSFKKDQFGKYRLLIISL